jgi:hypothetical protein
MPKSNLVANLVANLVQTFAAIRSFSVPLTPHAPPPRPRADRPPHDWARQQIAKAAPIGKDGGLCSSEADINDDEQYELFIHADVPSVLFVILVFEKVDGGYKYLGSIDSNPNTITFPRKNQIVTYQRCGGHNGVIVTYALKNNRLEVLHSSGMLNVGDGGDDKHNQQVSDLARSCTLAWKRMPNNLLQAAP